MSPIAKSLRIALVGATVACVLATAAAEEGTHWSYQGENGPARWGSIDSAFCMCKLGKHQSPIDIKDSALKKTNLPPIEFNYQPSALKIVDNGHTIQVNYEPGSTIAVGDTTYELIQFHFHKPSEEKIDGKSFDMVAHLVHRNAEGKLAVVAVLIRNGRTNPLIETLWNSLPPDKGMEGVSEALINASRLLPANRSYYTFTGSLTTPPCTEGVTWFVLRNPTQLSGEQIARFGRIYPMNARPVQPLNGRVVQVSR